jgi:2-phosphoglycerate kinase
MDAIWNLQSYMLDQAERNGIPVIANWRVEETVQRILEEVMARICERFPAVPDVLD